MRPGHRLACLVLTASALLLAGCTVRVGGTAEPLGGNGVAVSGAARCDPSGPLTACVLPVPSGSQVLNDDGWPSGQVTVLQFTAYYYPDDSARELGVLRGEGIQDLAHEHWRSSYDDLADVVLLRFDSAADAQRRLSGLVLATEDDDTLTKTPMPAFPDLAVFDDKQVDDKGFTGARAYGVFGRIELEVDLRSPHTLDTADLTSWLQTEIALLPQS